MYTVYVLLDQNGKTYKGMTNDLERRLVQHRQGHTRTTKQMVGITVVHTEVYPTRAEARKREIYLKSAAGRVFLKKLLSTRS